MGFLSMAALGPGHSRSGTLLYALHFSARQILTESILQSPVMIICMDHVMNPLVFLLYGGGSIEVAYWASSFSGPRHSSRLTPRRRQARKHAPEFASNRHTPLMTFSITLYVNA
jgi:hypothetical protein